MQMSLLRSLRILGSCALALWLGACSSGGSSGSSPGSGGSGPGTGGSGPGTGGSVGTGGSGTGGSVGTGGSGPGSGGSVGTGGSGGTGVGGSVGTGGSGGATGTGGAGGTGGAAGGATGTGGTGMVVKSTGCGMAPAATDSMKNFIQKTIMISGVDPAFISMYPVNAGSQFNWTKRNYYVRLPANYDENKAYPVDMEGTGCNGPETSGSSGEYSLPNTPNQAEAIQIGLSYVTSMAANSNCSAFTDDYVNSPEPPYLNGVIDEVLSKYCADTGRVFIHGYSSGAFEASMAGGAVADKIRAIGLQVGGGMRMKHPPYKTNPVAAMFVVGTLDQGNPIGPLATPLNDTVGSVAARDELLKRNGCVASDFQIVDTCAHGIMVAMKEPNPLPCTAGILDGDTYSNVPHEMWDPLYPKCMKYSNCPAKYPVVWCPLDVNHGNGPNPMGADMTQIENYRRVGMWKFFSSLPE
jgi:hypothetical protein